MSFETFIGWRYLKAKRRQTFISLISMISLIGVALGVTALIVVLAVMSGSEQEMRRRILGLNSHIVLLRFGDPLKGHQQLAEKISENPNVTRVEPFVYSQVMLSSSKGVSGSILRGLDWEQVEKSGRMDKLVKSGSLDDLIAQPGAAPGILLGKELAGKLGVKTGDTIRLVSPIGRITPLGNRVPAVKNFKVAGLFESGMYDFDSNMAFVALGEAQKLMAMGDTVTGLDIWVDDIYRADEIRESILERLDSLYWARDWMQMNRNLFTALKASKNRHVHYSKPHHYCGRVQYRVHPDHGGDGENKRYRHLKVHGRYREGYHAHIRPPGIVYRRPGNAAWGGWRRYFVRHHG